MAVNEDELNSVQFLKDWVLFYNTTLPCTLDYVGDQRATMKKKTSRLCDSAFILIGIALKQPVSFQLGSQVLQFQQIRRLALTLQ